MLKNRIISTLKFFDLQDYPLTLLELHKFLIADLQSLNGFIDAQGELKVFDYSAAEFVAIDEVLNCLDNECQLEVQNYLGFYYLTGRKEIVNQRLQNYFYGIKRERLIKRYSKGLKHLPFVRGVAISGSQAMGQEKPGSDIDLLIITDTKFLWLSRTLVTAYFQIFGKRRYGKNIANRFCLNHYLAGPKKISSLRNLYTATEYLKLRPIVGGHSVWSFGFENKSWLKVFFPNADFKEPKKDVQPKLQHILENALQGKFGFWLEKALKNWQMPKIRREKFIVVENDELSFHPDSKQQGILSAFFSAS